MFAHIYRKTDSIHQPWRPALAVLVRAAPEEIVIEIVIVIGLRWRFSCGRLPRTRFSAAARGVICAVVCARTHTYACACTYTDTYSYTYIYIYIYICVYTHVRIHTYTYIDICICMYTYIYIHIYIEREICSHIYILYILCIF